MKLASHDAARLMSSPVRACRVQWIAVLLFGCLVFGEERAKKVQHEDDHVVDKFAEDLQDMSTGSGDSGICFINMDTNHDGIVDKSEYCVFHRKPLKHVRMQSCSMKIAVEASDRLRGQMFDRLDRDHNGLVSQKEWHRIFGKAGHNPEEDMHKEQEFGHLVSESGSLQERLKNSGRLLHLLHTHADQERAFWLADFDRSKTISLTEFKAFMAKPHEEHEEETKAHLKRRAQESQDSHLAFREQFLRADGKMSPDKDEVDSNVGAASDGTIPHYGRRPAEPQQEQRDLFATRQREIEERMMRAHDSVRSLRNRQLERTFDQLDQNDDHVICEDEWYSAISSASKANEAVV